MQDIVIIQFINSIASFLALIPIVIYFRNYKLTRLIDYLLFGTFLIAGVLILTTETIFKSISNFGVVIIHHIAIDTGFFILFLHAIHFRWVTKPKPILIIGFTWYALLLVFGYSTNYSPDYRLLGDLYRLYVLILLITFYSLVKPKYLTQNAQKAKRIWIIAWIFLLIHSLNLINTPIFPYSELMRIFYFLWIILTVYITLFIPEGLILSESQITKAIEFFSHVSKEEIETKFIFLDLDVLDNYMKELQQVMDKNK